MDKIKNDESLYIDKLKPKLNKIFGLGYVTAHIEVEPVLLSAFGEDDISMVACDLVCDDPASTYNINIIVEPQVNFAELDTPRVLTLQDAKDLAMAISQLANETKLYS